MDQTDRASAGDHLRPAGTPKLLDRVRSALRIRHYSPRTEQAYVQWIKRYIFFHGVRNPPTCAGSTSTAS